MPSVSVPSHRQFWNLALVYAKVHTHSAGIRIEDNGNCRRSRPRILIGSGDAATANASSSDDERPCLVQTTRSSTLLAAPRDWVACRKHERSAFVHPAIRSEASTQAQLPTSSALCGSSSTGHMTSRCSAGSHPALADLALTSAGSLAVLQGGDPLFQ